MSRPLRELVLKMSVSIDGFVGGPGGEVDWIFRTAMGGVLAGLDRAVRGADERDPEGVLLA